MVDSVIGDFDIFMQTVEKALARHQALEQENADLKTGDSGCIQHCSVLVL